MGDAGLTGRKIIVDTYGGYARHGGGAFSGKDPSKVDRSAAYAMRWVAKNVVAAKLATKCEVQVAYAIGKAEPVGCSSRRSAPRRSSPERISEAVMQTFDLRPAAIIRDLDLKRPIYAQTAAYGHFGRELRRLHLGAHRPRRAARKLVTADPSSAAIATRCRVVRSPRTSGTAPLRSTHGMRRCGDRRRPIRPLPAARQVSVLPLPSTGADGTRYATARKVETLADWPPPGARTLALDVTDEESMVAAVEAVVAEHGRVGALVNNAGYGEYGAVEDVPVDRIRRQFETNVFGLARMCQLVLPSMRAAGAGRIVNIGSMGGRLTFPYGGYYHATKHAVEALSDALRFEVRAVRGPGDPVRTRPDPHRVRQHRSPGRWRATPDDVAVRRGRRRGSTR